MKYQDGTAKEEPTPIGRAFAALSDPHRRSVCRYAMRTDAVQLEHAEIADYIVDRTQEGTSDDPDRRTVATELRHVHLPKLEDAGLVEYDRERGVVRADRETIAAQLDRLRETVVDLQDSRVDG